MSGFSMRIDSNIAAVSKALGGLSEEVMKKAIVPAVNKTAATVKTRVVRKIADDTKTRQKVIREKIKVVKARQATTKMRGRFYAIVDATDARAINLIEYVSPAKRKVGFFNQVTITKSGKKKYRSKGVVANAWGTRKVYKGTFIGTSGSGQLKVYRRVGKARDKITQVPGPSPASIFAKPATFQFMREVIDERFPIEFERAVKLVIDRFNRKNK